MSLTLINNVFDDVLGSFNLLAIVNTINLLAVILVTLCVALRPNPEWPNKGYNPAQINNFAQDILEFVSSNVVILLVEYAPLCVFIFSRARFTSYVYMINAVILFSISLLLRVNIPMANLTPEVLESPPNYDDFKQHVSAIVGAPNNQQNWTKLTSLRYRLSKILRGSSFSCAVIAIFTLIMDYVNF